MAVLFVVRPIPHTPLFIPLNPLIQEATVNFCCIGGSFTRCSCHDFGYQLILFFRCPYFVLILVLQCIRTARFLYSGPPLNHFMKVLLLDAIWRPRPFSFPIHFYTHSLVLIAVFHIAIPPILGVQYWGYISFFSGICGDILLFDLQDAGQQLFSEDAEEHHHHGQCKQRIGLQINLGIV